MAVTNNVTQFIFTGLSQDQEAQRLSFMVFLPTYMATMFGNGLVILTVNTSKNLSSPMYFFLSHPSLVEICSPLLLFLSSFLAYWLRIKPSLDGCMTQLFFFHFFEGDEILLLTVMAYDQYVAICKPLHYMTLMSCPVCHVLVFSSWLGGMFHSVVQILITVQLPFCGPNVIDHYFCDLHPLFKLACADTFVAGIIVFANSGLFCVVFLIFLISSYIVILVHLRNQSTEGRRKALSTCASHITVVLLFFGPAIFLYLQPSSTFTEDKVVAVFYAMITPTLNHIIYILRNAEVKNAMQRLRRKKVNSRVE